MTYILWLERRIRGLARASQPVPADLYMEARNAGLNPDALYAQFTKEYA